MAALRQDASANRAVIRAFCCLGYKIPGILEKNPSALVPPEARNSMERGKWGSAFCITDKCLVLLPKNLGVPVLPKFDKQTCGHEVGAKE
jgi:hypothetical protein